MVAVRNNPPGGAGDDRIIPPYVGCTWSVGAGETFIFARWHLSRDDYCMQAFEGQPSPLIHVHNAFKGHNIDVRKCYHLHVND